MAKQPKNREEKEEKRAAAEKRVRNEKLLNAQLREADKIVQSILDKEDLSLETYADKLQLSARLNENAKVQATILGRIEDLGNSNAKNAEVLAEQYTSVNDLVGRAQSKFADIVLNSENITSSSFDTVDLSQDLMDISDKQFELDQMRNVIGKQEYERLTGFLELAKERLKLAGDQNEAQKEANKLAKEYLDNGTLVGAGTKEILHSLEEFQSHVGTGGLGIIGTVFGKKAGHYLEQINDDINTKVTKAFQESGTAAINSFSVARMALGSFTKFAIPALGILGVLGIMGFLIKSAHHLDEELSEIGKDFGVSRHEAEAIHHEAKGIAYEMKLVGVNSEQVTDAIKQTVSVLGGLNIVGLMEEGSEATAQLVKDVSVLNNVFGITDTETGGLSNIMDFSVMMRKSMGQVVKESVKLGKGLLSAKQSIMTITKISPNIAVAFKKGSVELLKAAQRAKLLGIELDDVMDYGDKILDIESSLEAEMSARVISGRKLNFDLARQYALQGDVASLQEEMLTQLGSLTEYQSMNRLQQKYLAEAFGMTVDEVAKLLTAQEKLVQLGIDQTKMDEIQRMNAAQLADEMKKTSNEELKSYLQKLGREKQSAALNERINDSLTKIKEKLGDTLAPLLEQVHHWLDSAEGAHFLETVISGIEKTMKALAPIVKFLSEHLWIVGAALVAIIGGKAISGIGSVVKGFSSIAGAVKGLGGVAQTAKPAVDAFGGAFGDLASEMGNTSQTAGELTQSMNTTANAAGELSKSVGGAGEGAGGIGGFVSSLSTTAVNMAIVGIALIAFAGALWITAKAFQEFGKVDWGNAWPGILVMAALAGVAWVLAGSVEGMAIAALGIGLLAGALLAFAASVYIIGLGAKMFADSIGTMADGIKKFASIKNITTVVDTIKKVINSISDIGSTVNPVNAKKIKETFKNLGIDQLVEFGKLATVDLGKAGDNLEKAIKSIGDISVEGILSKIDFGQSSGWSYNPWFGMILGWTKRAGKGIIGAFEKLNDALGQLKLDNIDALAKLATTDMSKIGDNIKTALNSLASLTVSKDVLDKLQNTKEIFDQVWNVLERGYGESRLGPLEKLASLDMTKLKDTSYHLKDFVYNLAQIGVMGGVDGLTRLAEKFEILNTALEKLDIDKLQELSNINADNLAKIASVFQTPQTVNTTTTASNVGGGESEGSQTNKKLDKVISVLESIFGTANQPVMIQIGDRTVEAIGRKWELNKKFLATHGNSGRG